MILGLKNKLGSELLACVFDACVGVGGDEKELAQSFVCEQLDASVVEPGHHVAGVRAEKEGLVCVAVLNKLVQKFLLASQTDRWNVLEFLEGVGEHDGAVWAAVFKELKGVIVD